MGLFDILTSVGSAVLGEVARDLERTAQKAERTAPPTAKNLAKIEEMKWTAERSREKAKEWSSKICTECNEQLDKCYFDTKYADMRVGVCYNCEQHHSESREKANELSSKTCTKCNQQLDKCYFSAEYADMKVAVCYYCEQRHSRSR